MHPGLDFVRWSSSQSVYDELHLAYILTGCCSTVKAKKLSEDAGRLCVERQPSFEAALRRPERVVVCTPRAEEGAKFMAYMPKSTLECGPGNMGEEQVSLMPYRERLEFCLLDLQMHKLVNSVQAAASAR